MAVTLSEGYVLAAQIFLEAKGVAAGAPVAIREGIDGEPWLLSYALPEGRLTLSVSWSPEVSEWVTQVVGFDDPDDE